MSIFRTTSLFHYTSFNSLKAILQQGLVPNYCKEELDINGDKHVLGIPMISFCDIPLTRTQEFTSRYGRHAISLKKEWAIKHHINPILYLNEDILPISLKNTDMLMGFVKSYNGRHKKTSQCNYEENEWRYVVSNSTDTKWKENEIEYKKWRGTATNKPKADSYLEAKKLTFSIDDISYIIVEQENQRSSFAQFINKMKMVGGNATSISEKEKLALISKIISMQQINRDF